jgi:hypothetical protein
VKTLATAVYNSEEITLLDDTNLFLRTMTIKNRRKFMKAFNELANGNFDGENPDDAEDALLKLIPYCVRGQRPEWEEALSDDEAKVEEALDKMTDALDTETVYYIIKQTAGIDLKAMDQMVQDMMMKEASAGTN